MLAPVVVRPPVCSLAEVKSPPFEVTEMGWGEFEAKMTMHFKDPSEKPVDVLHQLRLYHDAAAGTTQPKKVQQQRGRPACVCNFCDAIASTGWRVILRRRA